MGSSRTVGSLCALLATAIWSGNFIIARGLNDILPPVTLAALRWSLATAVLLPFAARIMWRQRALLRAHLPHLACTAFIGVSCFNALLYHSAHTTDALNMTLIATTTPAFTVLLARLFLGEPVTRFRAVGLAAAVAGIVVLVTRGDLAVLRDLAFRTGDLWMLLAAFLWAAYTILLKKKPKEIHPTAYLGSTFVLGLAPLLPAALIESASSPAWSVTPGVAGAILYLGVGCSLASYVLWNKAVGEAGPVITTFIYYSLPAFTALEATLILHETATWAHAVGFVLILGGIVAATHPRFNRPSSGRRSG